jgi:hypothetical protein
MKQAMWDVDVSDGMSFRDPRARGAVDPNQPTLWGGAGAAEPELVELVTQRLRQGAASVDELGKCSCWRLPALGLQQRLDTLGESGHHTMINELASRLQRLDHRSLRVGRRCRAGAGVWALDRGGRPRRRSGEVDTIAERKADRTTVQALVRWMGAGITGYRCRRDTSVPDRGRPVGVDAA